MTVYADASALVKLIVDEAESPAARAYLVPGLQVAASRLVAAEVPRALRRRYDADPAWAEGVLGEIDLIDVSPVILSRAARLDPPVLRTLDAVHLVSAMELGADLEAFLTYDARLAAAARGAGLTVVSPGAQLTGVPGGE